VETYTRLLRGLALLATGVETMLLPRRPAGDTITLTPASAATASGEDTVVSFPAARAPRRLTARVIALAAPLTPRLTAAATKARQTVLTARAGPASHDGTPRPTRGGARRVAIVGLLSGGVLAVLLSPLRAWIWGRVRRSTTGAAGPDKATTSIVHTARQGASRASARVRHMRQRTPRDTAGLDDATLVDKVESAVFRDPTVPKGRININAERGRVVLRGEVDQPEQISALDAAVRQVPGVTDVENLLHLPGTSAPQS
jgi:hypothetical protein